MFMYVKLYIYWFCLLIDNYVGFKYFWDYDWGIKLGLGKCIVINVLEYEFNLEYLNLL